MKTLLYIFLFTYSVTAFTQNYDCLQFGPKNYFINGNGYVRGIRIDSMRSAGSNTIYYPYRTRRISNYLSWPTTIDTFGGSWLGKKVIKQIDGTFIFDNIWDTVVIKSLAHRGDSWIFFNDTSVFSYTASVIAEDTMTILGSLDSVKKIMITADSAGVFHPVDPVNNFQIILSKNNGFVQTFDLYTFPYHRPDTTFFHPGYGRYDIRHFDYYLDVLLNNLGTCDLGCFDNPPDTNNSVFRLFAFHNPTLMEIYDFAIGDVYETDFSVGDYGSHTEIYTLDSVMSKTTSPFNVAYGGTEHKKKMDYPHPGPPVVTYPTAYFSMSGGDTSRLINPRVMPEEYPQEYILHFYQHLFPGWLSCDNPASYVFLSYGFVYTGIATVPTYDSTVYTIGYGLSKKEHYDPMAYSSYQQYIYYYKDSVACGTFTGVIPVDTVITPINTDKTKVAISGLNSNIQIMPNPATNNISILPGSQFDNNTSISIYDVTGKCIFRTTNDLQNTLTINTSSWSSGLYLVIIQNNSGIQKKEKIIIRQ